MYQILSNRRSFIEDVTKRILYLFSGHTVHQCWLAHTNSNIALSQKTPACATTLQQSHLVRLTNSAREILDFCPVITPRNY